MADNLFHRFLFKYNMLIQPLVSAAGSLFFGLHLIRIENQISKGENWITAFYKVGITSELLIAALFLILLLLYHYYIVIKPIKRFEENKKSIINGLLASITKAIFDKYGNDLEVSATVQVCDYHKHTREAVYQYNTSDQIYEEMDIEFGDVGEKCVKNKAYLNKVFSYDDWLNNTEEYRQLVPDDLRIIFAKPITNNKNKVIAVLEIDIYENTTESDRGESKVGYLTNNVTIEEVTNDLKRRKIKKTLGDWAKSIASLI